MLSIYTDEISVEKVKVKKMFLRINTMFEYAINSAATLVEEVCILLEYKLTERKEMLKYDSLYQKDTYLAGNSIGYHAIWLKESLKKVF